MCGVVQKKDCTKTHALTHPLRLFRPSFLTVCRCVVCVVVASDDMAASVTAKLLQRDPAWTAPLIQQERKKAILAKPQGYSEPPKRSVIIRNRPSLPSNTATAQIHARAVANEEGPAEGTANSECFPPAKIEHRSFKPGTIVLQDMRPKSKDLQLGTADGSMPAPVVVPNYRGVRLDEAHLFRVAGVSLTEHKAELIEHGHDELQTIQTAGMTAVPNTSENTLYAGTLVAFGPPTMQQVLKANGRDVDTSQFPKSNIFEARDGSMGDFSDCPPVPRPIVVSSVADRLHQVHLLWETEPDRNSLNLHHMKMFLRTGSAWHASKLAQEALAQARQDGHAETNAQHEIVNIFMDTQNKIRSTLPEVGMRTEQTKGTVSLPPLAVGGDPRLLTENNFIALTDDTSHRNHLARLWRHSLGAHDMTEAEAIEALDKELAMEMACWDDGKAPLVPANAYSVDAQNKETWRHADFVNFLKNDCCVQAPAAVVDWKTANGKQKLYATLRRRQVLSYELFTLANSGKCMATIMEDYQNQAHMLVTSDSRSGSQLTGLVMLHPT